MGTVRPKETDFWALPDSGDRRAFYIKVSKIGNQKKKKKRPSKILISKIVDRMLMKTKVEGIELVEFR